MTATYSLQAAPTGSGAALAIVQLSASSAAQLDLAMQMLGIEPVEPGRLALRDLLDVDRGVVARWTPTCVHLMPHGGVLIVRRLCEAMEARGIAPARATAAGAADPRSVYPEANSLLEACLLDALARAASPLAIDVLLQQPELWRDARTRFDASAVEAHSRVLNRLIEPPVVALIGPPNIGKSTLTNALARREVSIVADEPGTTRDHVGVLLDLAGLVVRWIDCPGFRDASAAPDAIERAAAALAREAASRADLVLSCADGGSGFVDSLQLGDGLSGGPLLVGLRADLGPARGAKVQTAAAKGQGLTELALAVRRHLVPDEAMESRTPWRFHDALPTQPGAAAGGGA